MGAVVVCGFFDAKEQAHFLAYQYLTLGIFMNTVNSLRLLSTLKRDIF